MRVIVDNLWLCSDCMQVSVNGSYGMDISAEQLERTEKGLAELGMHLVPVSGDERTFSSIPCASCKTSLAGYRARFAILG